MVTYDRVWVVLRRGLSMDSKIIQSMMGRNNYVSSFGCNVTSVDYFAVYRRKFPFAMLACIVVPEIC
jgi:hypothetical protein